jgi:hypothetical protein
MAFNSLPAALTPDWKGLHYLTGANQVLLDKGNHAPGIQNRDTMFSYSPYEVYRCCEHNVSHGWPYYAEELWLAVPDGGLCASLYAPSEVSAKVSGGLTVKITEETEYPFDDTITLKISMTTPVNFPLHLRIPNWCKNASVKVNDHAVAEKEGSIAYAVISREWKDGDVIKLRLPMELTVKTWEKNHNAVSVSYGPLSFSLKIGEKWTRYGGTDNWPEYEVSPQSPWNYGLVLNSANPARSFQLVRKPGPIAANPFTQETAPIELRVKAKKIPGWQLDRTRLVAALQDSPIKSEEPVETVTLIPMSAARLRITMFPVIGGSDAKEWAGSN